MTKFYSIATAFIVLMASWQCGKKEAAISAPLAPPPSFNTNTLIGAKQKDFFDKYGVIFEYEWNRAAYAPNVIADPAKKEDVLPYMELLEEIYFKAMDSVGAPGLTTKETPVRMLLIGSGINYGGKESAGEGTAGQAGNIQPNRLTLGGLTSFGQLLRAKGTNADKAFLKAIYDEAPSSSPPNGGLISFVYHEYTHYLDSKHQIPLGFQEPSKTEYLRGSNQYKRVSDSVAISKGFCIPYGMQNEHEDFATYVQTMVWLPDSTINKKFLISDPLTKKYKLVDGYFQNMGLSLIKLRDYLQSPAVKARLIALKRKYE